jgi:outer membrane lipoprotein SlyB
MRRLAALTIMAQSAIVLAGCGPSYSPDTYASNAAQQANKVDEGVIAGVRPVQISAQGTVGGVAGAAAGGVAGSQVGVGPASAFGAIGGSLVGGVAGVATEHIVGDTNGFEYMVRKLNGDLVSVAQKEDKPLRVGQKVLVIAGPQARIVPDYTVPFEAPPKAAAKPPAPGQPATAESHPPATDGTGQHPPTAPAETGVPPQLPAAFGSPSTSPPPIIVPPETAVTPPTVSPPASTVQKPP